MAKSESKHITSCTISWKNTEDILSVVTKVLQTEIQVRKDACRNNWRRELLFLLTGKDFEGELHGLVQHIRTYIYCCNYDTKHYLCHQM